MTTFYLIRHAEKDVEDERIPGRTPGVHLSETGRRQAEELAEALAEIAFDSVLSSPLERAQETAQYLARRHSVEVQVSDEVNEMDFGEWSNLTPGRLAQIETWGRFNTFRSGVRIPGGETMAEVQARFVGKILDLCAQYENGTVAVVSHGDPIKSVLAYFLGVPLDLCQRIEIDPASVSILELAPWGARVVWLNRVVNLTGY